MEARLGQLPRYLFPTRHHPDDDDIAVHRTTSCASR